MTPDDQTLVDQMKAALGPVSGRLAVAVSGGGDSMALLHLLARAVEPSQLCAATVDHGLRSGSAQEAAQVAAFCAQVGIGHTTLRWTGWDGQGNLQDQARRARYRLLTDWAKAQGASALAVGHTADDQAETVLMRLTRGAGVNGLSAMQTRIARDGLTLLRPLLGIRRADLRSYLSRHSVVWIDDPSNDDTKFTRIRLRQSFDQLAPLGLTVESLCDVAANMNRARAALNVQTQECARRNVTLIHGCIRVDLSSLAQPDEILWRLLTQSIAWITGAEYAPRGSAMERLIADLRNHRPATLAGCRFFFAKDAMWIARELAATASAAQVWDNRWRLNDPRPAELGALGRDGLAELAPLPDTDLPRIALESVPAVRVDRQLVAVPALGFGAGWALELLRNDEEFFSSLLSH